MESRRTGQELVSSAASARSIDFDRTGFDLAARNWRYRDVRTERRKPGPHRTLEEGTPPRPYGAEPFSAAAPPPWPRRDHQDPAASLPVSVRRSHRRAGAGRAL